MDSFRADAGLLDGVATLGTGSVVERLWTRPACTVIALDATAVSAASNTLAATARAKISLRVAPGDSGAQALSQLVSHLEAHAPWGAQVTVTPGGVAEPCELPTDGPFTRVARAALGEAFEAAAVEIGQGGTIPLVAELAAAYPEAEIVLTAVADPDSLAHGADESLPLADFAAACRAEAAMLAGFAELQ